MCGIIGGFSPLVEQGILSLMHRGPDADGLIQLGNLFIGHTRLSIIDLDSRSNQPFIRGDIVLSYNGELWNYVKLREELQALGQKFITSGDTEVVAAAIDVWGQSGVSRLNGMFAIAWAQNDGLVHLARDRFGEVPLHVAIQRPFLFASEIKALIDIGAHPKSIRWVEPGTILTASDNKVKFKRYYNLPIRKSTDNISTASIKLQNLIKQGVQERTISDVPVCMLLSGGIDSASIAWHLSKVFPKIIAYIAVYNMKSRDLRCAREISEILGIELREVSVPVPTVDDISYIVQAIEMPHKAQVEIGWACLKLAERIHADGFKVTYSGEGSDELWASYGFAYHALKTQDWYIYRKHLYIGQHRKNFARCNKIFMTKSVECRLPFLSTNLVEYALSLSEETVQPDKKMKAVMVEAYHNDLPSSIINRPKLAFQDGMGIKKKISSVFPNPVRFYRSEFNRLFGGTIA